MNRRRSKRVLLVTPPYHSGVVESAGSWLPLGLLYVGGALQEAGHEVALYDAMTRFDTLDEVRATLKLERPEVVMVSCITATFPDGAEVCRVAKEEDPEVLTVLGNTHPTFMWKQVLEEHPWIDVVVRGEGEATAVELLEAYSSGASLTGIAGLACRDDDGRPVATERRPFLADLDQAEPAWNLVPWKEYFYRPKMDSVLAVVSSSRGCTQACSFCSQRLFWREGWRALSAKCFVSQIEALRDTHGVTVAMLADETPTMDRERWEAILDLLIEREVGVSLLLETRVDDIVRDADILPRYRRAGIEHIYVGVESVNQATLDLFKKDLQIEQSKQAIDLIRDADMVSETSFVMGMPDETAASMDRTIELSKYYDPDMAFFLAITPWPYAELFDQVKEHIVTTDYRSYNLVEPVVKPRSMTIDEVQAKLFEGFRIFYTDKMHRLASMPPWKQEFMKTLMRLFMEHSYLKDQMAGMGHPGGGPHQGD